MEFHRNAVYFSSSFPDFGPYQGTEGAAPAPAADPWGELELSQDDWNAPPPIDPELGSPHFIEVPQVPQIPTLHTLSELLSPHPAQQLAGPSFKVVANDPGGNTDVAVGTLLNAVQDDQTQAQHQLSARRRSKNPAKRRELNLKKGTQLNALRQTLGVSHGTTKLETLNTAIERLRGNTAKTEAMAYLELHWLTGRRGRLRHIECLQAANDALSARSTGDEVPQV